MNAAKVNMDEATEYLPNGQRVGDIGTPARTELFPSWQGERPVKTDHAAVRARNSGSSDHIYSNAHVQSMRTP